MFFEFMPNNMSKINPIKEANDSQQNSSDNADSRVNINSATALMNELDAFRFELEDYEGPLDLMVHLVNKHEMNIFDVNLGDITSQFIAELEIIKGNRLSRNFDYIGEFVVLASYLVYWKSRSLLPVADQVIEEMEDEFELSEFELKQKLITYSFYKYCASYLKEKQTISRKSYSRNEPIMLEYDNGEIVIVFNNATKKRHDEPSVYMLMQNYFRLVDEKSRREVTIDNDNSVIVPQVLSDYTDILMGEPQILWSSILPYFEGKRERAIVFFYTLEFAKLHILQLFQDEPFADFLIERLVDNIESLELGDELER